MIKRVATTIVLSALVGGTALADAKLGGDARQLSMGGGAAGGVAVNPFIWSDPVVQYANPAWQSMYRDYVWMNVGGGSLTGTTTGGDGYGLQDAGANVSLGDGWAIGAIFSHDYSQVASVVSLVGSSASGLTMAPVEVIDLVGSVELDDLVVGLALLYGKSGSDFEVTGMSSGNGKDELTASVFGARGGVYVDLGSGSALDIAAAFASSTVEDINATSTTPVTNEGTATEFGVGARAKLRVNNKVNFIPVGSFGSATGELNAAGTVTGEVNNTVFLIGVGADVTVGDFYMAGGVSFGSSSVELVDPDSAGATNTTTNSGFPIINIGIEYVLTDWLTGRGGYYRSWSNWENELVSGGVTYTENFFFGASQVGLGGYSADHLISLGIAMAFGNFGLEATVAESVLRRGAFGLGSSDNLNMFGYITTNYNFE